MSGLVQPFHSCWSRSATLRRTTHMFSKKNPIFQFGKGDIRISIKHFAVGQNWDLAEENPRLVFRFAGWPRQCPWSCYHTPFRCLEFGLGDLWKKISCLMICFRCSSTLAGPVASHPTSWRRVQISSHFISPLLGGGTSPLVTLRTFPYPLNPDDPCCLLPQPMLRWVEPITSQNLTFSATAIYAV